MVIIKRYIGKIRKPLHWKGRKAFLRLAVLPALVATGLLLVVRTMIVTQYAMPCNRYDLDLLSGDRLVVNRLAYGWRTPLPAVFGKHEVGKRPVRKGDLVAFVSPIANRQVLVERVEALPGDTIDIAASASAGRENRRRFVINSGYCRVGAYVIPQCSIIGRIIGITYSIDPQAPFHRCLRRERFLLKTDE